MTAPAQSRRTRSLRPLWLIVAFYLISLLTQGVLDVIAVAILGPRAIDPQNPLFQCIQLASVVFATWIMLRRVEKLPWSTIGLDRAAAAPVLIARGAALGGLTIGIASLLLLAMGMLRVDQTLPGSWWGEAWRSTLVFLPAAFFEELFMRGYAFAVLRRAAGWKLALIVTSVAFGLLHALNPNLDAESILAVFFA